MHGVFIIQLSLHVIKPIITRRFSVAEMTESDTITISRRGI